MYKVGIVKWFGGKRRSRTGDKFGFIDGGDRDYHVHQDQLKFDASRMYEGKEVIFISGSKNNCKEVYLLEEFIDAKIKYQSILQAHKEIFVKLIRTIKRLFNEDEVKELVIKKFSSLDSSRQWDLEREFGMDYFWKNDDLRRQLSIYTRMHYFLKMPVEDRKVFIKEMIIDAQIRDEISYLSEIPMDEYLFEQDIRKNAPVELQMKLLKATSENIQLHEEIVKEFKNGLKRMKPDSDWKKYRGTTNIEAPLLFDNDVWKYLPVTEKVNALSNLDINSKANYRRLIVSHLRELLYNGLSLELQMKLVSLGPEILIENKTWSLVHPQARFYLVCHFPFKDNIVKAQAKRLFPRVLSESSEEFDLKLLMKIPSWLLIEEAVLTTLYETRATTKLKT